MQDTIEGFVTSVRRSQTLRLFSLGFLVLLLLIPVAMLSGLVAERQARRDSVAAEVASKWGNVQSITGPALVVPYTHRWTERSGDGDPVVRTQTRHATFLPEELRVRGRATTESRHRGIFTVPVYRLALTLEGEFARPSFADFGVEGGDIAWSRAHLAVGISDVRAIQEETAVAWNGKEVAFLPGTKAFAEARNGIHALVGVDAGSPHFRFSVPLTLNGSVGVYFAPVGRSTVVDLESDYPHPSFQGNWLPADRAVSSDGFRARWSIPFLGRNYPQAWTSESSYETVVAASHFGVAMANPVDHYRMAERSVKYAGLFILLTFGSVWLLEVLSGVRVHPIQYLMLGAALCLFYLLEVSLSEHVGFPAAYAVASTAVIAMVAAYSWIALRTTGRAFVVAGLVTLLYVYLYILLMNEDYALLIGSLGLFAIVASIMYATRRVDWYAAGERSAS